MMNVIAPTIEDGLGEEAYANDERLAAAIAESRALRTQLAASAERLRHSMDRYTIAVRGFKTADQPT